MKFGEYELETHPYISSGVGYRIKFDNGFGASVVRSSYTYGGSEGLWELAVIDKSGELDYKTSVTNDVIGWLSEADVVETLDKIKALENREKVTA